MYTRADLVTTSFLSRLLYDIHAWEYLQRFEAGVNEFITRVIIQDTYQFYLPLTSQESSLFSSIVRVDRDGSYRWVVLDLRLRGMNAGARIAFDVAGDIN